MPVASSGRVCSRKQMKLLFTALRGKRLLFTLTLEIYSNYSQREAGLK